jgi:hypothetical protein
MPNLIFDGLATLFVPETPADSDTLEPLFELPALHAARGNARHKEHTIAISFLLLTNIINFPFQNAI